MYLLGFVMGLVTTYVLAVIIGSAGVTTWWVGESGLRGLGRRVLLGAGRLAG